jgi:hypothetical protein
VEDRWAAKAQNLSETGLKVRLNRPFLPGSQLIGELEAAEGQPARWLLSRVVHVTELTPGEWLLGCVFKKALNEEEVRTLLLGSVSTVREIPG